MPSGVDFFEARKTGRSGKAAEAKLRRADRELQRMLAAKGKRGEQAAAIRAFDALAAARVEIERGQREASLVPPRERPVALRYGALVKAEGRVFGAMGPKARFALLDAERIWWKITWVLGVHDVWPQVKEFFEEKYPGLIDDILDAIRKKDWKRARRLLRRLLGIMGTDEFAEWLAKKLGKKKAKEILAKIGLKLIPGLGWMVTAAMILAAILAQFIIE